MAAQRSQSVASRSELIDSLRNSAPNPWMARLTAVLDDLHRESLHERKRRREVEAKLEAILKRESLAV